MKTAVQGRVDLPWLPMLAEQDLCVLSSDIPGGAAVNKAEFVEEVDVAVAQKRAGDLDFDFSFGAFRGTERDDSVLHKQQNANALESDRAAATAHNKKGMPATVAIVRLLAVELCRVDTRRLLVDRFSWRRR